MTKNRSAYRRYTDAGPGQMHWRIWEASAGASGPPLVCLHPCPYSGAYFETVAPLLAMNRRVYAPDYPGYGGSDGFAEKPDIARIASAVLEGAGALTDGPYDLLGFHTGCLVAVEMALLDAGAVCKVALIDIPFFTKEKQAELYPSAAADVTYTPDFESLHKAWDFTVTKRLDAMPFDRAFSNFVEQLRAGDKAGWGFHAAFTYDCAARFAKLSHETLVLATKSGLSQPTLDAAAVLQNAKLVERSDVTRAVMEEGAGVIAEEVGAFL